MKHIKKIANFALLGSLGAAMATGFAGCSNDEQNEEISQKQGAFVILEETSKGKYKVVEEFPSSQTKIVLKDLEGNERVLSQAELDELMKAENAKIDNGTSNLTKEAQISSGGLSLGEAILASAAGAIIGSWIGSKLFNSPGYQSQRQTAYKNPSTYSRSVDNFKKASTTKSPSGGKSGFFGGQNKQSTSSNSVGG